MKYRVKVKQCIKYTETLVANFNSMEEVSLFCDVIMNSCKNVMIEIKTGESEEDDD